MAAAAPWESGGYPEVPLTPLALNEDRGRGCLQVLAGSRAALQGS